MKTFVFFLSLLVIGCQGFNPQPSAPTEPTATKPKPPENVSVYLITPNLSNLTWKYPGQNVDEFVISRGNSNGWTNVTTVQASTREYHDPLPSNLIGVDGIYYVITAVSSGIKSDTAMSNNLGVFRAYNAN
ncbi:MAG: hypothetical protein ABSF47_01410 [Minisyncoccia bacterium]|jgi:hypothetical protein